VGLNGGEKGKSTIGLHCEEKRAVNLIGKKRWKVRRGLSAKKTNHPPRENRQTPVTEKQKVTKKGTSSRKKRGGWEIS